MRKTLNDITMPTNKHFGDADVLTTREIQCILDNPDRAIGLEYHAEWNKKQLIVGSWKERNV